MTSFLFLLLCLTLLSATLMSTVSDELSHLGLTLFDNFHVAVLSRVLARTTGDRLNSSGE